MKTLGNWRKHLLNFTMAPLPDVASLQGLSSLAVHNDSQMLDMLVSFDRLHQHSAAIANVLVASLAVKLILHVSLLALMSVCFLIHV